MPEISFEEFYLLSKTDLRAAMEKFFNEHIDAWALEKLKDKLVSKELTIEKIYSIPIENPWYNSLSKIVKANWKDDYDGTVIKKVQR